MFIIAAVVLLRAPTLYVRVPYTSVRSYDIITVWTQTGIDTFTAREIGLIGPRLTYFVAAIPWSQNGYSYKYIG